MRLGSPQQYPKYAGLARAGISLLFLSFSRENERQADDLGVPYSSKAGYDAHRMANLFVTLERLNPAAGSDGLRAWFSTHPKPPARAADAFASANQATVVSAEATRINGLPAQRLVCDLATQQGVPRVLCCFVQKDDLVYAFLGYTGQARFAGYLPTFGQTIGGFSHLTDPGKVNVEPARIAVRKAPGRETLRQALQGFGVAPAALEAHAILNGMQLEDPLPADPAGSYSTPARRRRDVRNTAPASTSEEANHTLRGSGEAVVRLATKQQLRLQ